MQYLTTLVSFLIVFYEYFKGNKTVYEILGPNNALGNLQCNTGGGYQLTIYCQRKEYLVKYDKWYIPNRNIRTYRVSSLATSDAPYRLKQVCELDVELPDFVGFIKPERIVVKTMINAYLDLLQAKLGKMEHAA